MPARWHTQSAWRFTDARPRITYHRSSVTIMWPSISRALLLFTWPSLVQNNQHIRSAGQQKAR
eukprot:4180556-Ditylum_brightwellii.AAC.1